ncbi:thyroid adenoma-associated protein isoform X2 [Sorex araneus]|uniref:thyroid adenoma-associated protein isoform X2 n=1 Tax=Sorex araneus TaxID=42254 RepID=UPI0024337157|nr:thyroid adenoma-associated protein isoform X2 [Sorex araneus]
MGVKKKKDSQVTALAVCQGDLETLRALADTDGASLASMLLHCVGLPDGVSQIQRVKQIVPFLEKANKNGACDSTIRSSLDILAGIYFSLSLKNPLKKVLASTLDSLPAALMPAAEQGLRSRLQEELRTLAVDTHRRVLDNLSSCLDSFHLGGTSVEGLLDEVLHFLLRSLTETSEESRRCAGNHIVQTRLMNDLLAGVRVSMLLVQKVPGLREMNPKTCRPCVWQSLCGLLSLFSTFLGDDDLLRTIQSTCGLAVILFIKTMFQTPEKLPDLIRPLLLRSVDLALVPAWLLDCCGRLCGADMSLAALLFLCQGTLSMLDWRDGSMGPGAEALLLDTAHVLFTLDAQIKEAALEMFLARILASWTNAAIQALECGSPGLGPQLHGGSHLVGQLLDYVSTHWEHPLDALRHQTQVIFRNVLRIHRLTAEPGATPGSGFLSELTASLLRLDWHVRGKYACLAVLVECVGTEPVLAEARDLPSQVLEVMGDQALVPHAADLLETMFTSHKRHLQAQAGGLWLERWHETWAAPLLVILCEGSQAQKCHVIEYYLPRLLNCTPESLSYMVERLEAKAEAETGTGKCSGALGALMACLRAARAHGHLHSTSDTWRVLVSGTRMQQGLVHQHSQVRMDSLGLLCESQRSTALASAEELRWVLFFLSYNLHSPAPGVRQLGCALLRKLFLRIRESSQALYKLEQEASPSPGPPACVRQYQHFLAAVCDTLFQALGPGASYATKFSALTILGSLAEVFPCAQETAQTLYQLSDDVDGDRFQTLLECLTSTFEEVKMLAFDLLMKLPKAVLRFQGSEQLPALFQAALGLSTSTKPYDCVTASYLLRFLIGRDLLPPSLAACEGALPGTATARAERSSLQVLRCLLGLLEEDLALAEQSLLQAAASRPLYGRVHCISGVLRTLPLHELQLVNEWRCMVGRLLAASYRLSAVVAPIVQSSSPEGLIPMDTDPESAGRLQVILEEIQPRDTNTYFSEARVLQGPSTLDLGALGASLPGADVPAAVRGEDGRACDVTAQMVLVCCWRSMKEVALLLGTLCQLLTAPPRPEAPAGLLAEEQVKEIGAYFKQRLLQSRHRGAFELAYTGFVRLTETLSRCASVSLQKLPEQWLQSVLEEIKSSDPSSKLCATRRSAGIPFYIQALLASEPKKGTLKLLRITMRELLSLAGPGGDVQSTVPKVHALNILRALFRDTRLGENVIPYVAEGLQAAVLGFSSPVWAVRNSSTLLFSTLITRVFGVKRGKDELSKKNRMTGSEFFSRFPELYPFLLQQLEAVAEHVDSDPGAPAQRPGMFLLLLVLERLYPSPMDGAHSALSLAPFLPLITRCGRSPIYRCREMAARALVPLVPIDEVPRTVHSLLAKLPDPKDPGWRQNHVHGTLLQAFHLLRALANSTHRTHPCRQQELSAVALQARAKGWLAQRQNPCLVTRAVYLDLLFLLTRCLDGPAGGAAPALQHRDFWDDVGRILLDSELATGFPPASSAPGLPQYLRSLTQLAMAAVWAAATPSGGQGRDPPLALSLLLEAPFPEVRLLALDTLWERVSGPGRPPLLRDLGGTVLRLVVRESHSGCLCKILRILDHMDPGEWLPQVEACVQLSPKEFLSWTLDAASGERPEAPGVALRLASKVIANCPQTHEEVQELERWAHLVVAACADHQPSESQLAAAAALTSTATSVLASPRPVLGLQHTLALWKCVLTLLQSEDQAVRDAASETVTATLSQENTRQATDFAFCPVDAAVALPLAVTVLCHLLQQWDQLGPGLPVLLGWALEDSYCTAAPLDSSQQAEDDSLFEKDDVRLWVEPLRFVRHLCGPLAQLLAQPGRACGPGKLDPLQSEASEQLEHTRGQLRALPPAAAFLHTAQWTQLRVREEGALACLRLLTPLPGKERAAPWALIPRSPAEAAC